MTFSNNNYLFLSYRSVEGEVALKVAQDLRQQGINIWMDQLGGLNVSDNWIKGMQDAVDGASGMIIMLSPQYLESKFCRRELARGDQKGYPLFPLMIEDVAKDDASILLQETQHINLTQWQDVDAYYAAITNLIQIIETKVKQVLQPSLTPLSPNVDNKIYKARLLEDQLMVAAKQIQGTGTMGVAVKMKRKRLSSQITQYALEYEAVTEQLLIELNPASRVRLEASIAQLEQKVEKLESEIATLEA
ncbi:MAG: toll/interleukin-1 receptor domain-containing protein [Chloroflexi bacterium]|nr:MAG: toll/interleukin-1 receptor domain-containing protein [Chloroflexota bacterium]